MKIAILGFDRQGLSAYNYWSAEHDITICDKNDSLAIPKNAKSQLGDGYLDNLDDFDVLVRTPGLHPQKIVDANPNAPNILDKVTSVTNEFLRVCPTKNVIGVTGTKGKGTTSTLISNILASAGKRVHLGGNIGIPPLDLLKGAGLINDKMPGVLHGDAIQGADETRTEPYTKYEERELESVTQQSAPGASGDSGSAREQASTLQGIQPGDWVVLELANYQLIDLHYSPPIGVCLMITPEHLDWHESIDEYLRAKQQLFVHQTPDDIAIYKYDDNRSMQLAVTSLGMHIPYMSNPGAFVKKDSIVIDNQTVCKTSDIPLLGEHNQENVCAAITCAWQITQDVEAIKTGIKNSKSLPHRLEYIGEVGGVTFYNDSFATTTESTMAGIRAMTKPTVLILGGSDKGSDFTELAGQVNDSNVKHVIVIGKMGPVISKQLIDAGFNPSTIEEGGSTMEGIVKQAQKLSDNGDAVLLSPACASFDMFKNYEDRGEQFSQAVQALGQAEQ